MYLLWSHFCLLLKALTTSDSQNACRIIQVGLRKDLHVIALKIFQFCVDNGIELEMQWIPRTKLDRADFISRIIDVDDWQITTSFFLNCWIILGGLIQWTVLPISITKKSTSFIRDFGTQNVAEWISSSKI